MKKEGLLIGILGIMLGLGVFTGMGINRYRLLKYRMMQDDLLKAESQLTEIQHKLASVQEMQDTFTGADNVQLNALAQKHFVDMQCAEDYLQPSKLNRKFKGNVPEIFHFNSKLKVFRNVTNALQATSSNVSHVVHDQELFLVGSDAEEHNLKNYRMCWFAFNNSTVVN